MKNEINKEFLEANNISLKKKTSLLPLVLLVIAALAFAGGLCIDNNSEAKMPVLLLAVIMVVFGVAKILNMPSVLVSELHNEILKEEELYFDLKDKNNVIAMLRNGELKRLRAEAKESANYPLKAVVFSNQNGTIALFRVFHFVPYTFEPVTEFEIYKKQA